MIRWIDIVSPRLRSVHQAWCTLRGHGIIPHLKSYNGFVGSPAVQENFSLAAVFPEMPKPPSFRAVGSVVSFVIPELQPGMSFADISSIPVRTFITTPFHEVETARQPDCRRGNLRGMASGRPFEQLLLPFGDDKARVRLVHALFELAPQS
ncbi:hypothetical protein [Radicibacter daui]|uniref:hypothetical protein n=1 Tax=Radicibacter daui TaxID=3064829 RepID=UPI004046EA75